MLKLTRAKNQEPINNIRRLLEAKRQNLDAITSEEKAMDKNARRELADIGGDHYELLYKLFKRRKNVQLLTVDMSSPTGRDVIAKYDRLR